MTSEQVAAEASKRLTAKLPGFDPSVIIGIITSILKALGVCGLVNPAEIKKRAADGGILTRIQLRRAMDDEGLTFHQKSVAVQAALDLGAEASEDEIVAFCHCCD